MRGASRVVSSLALAALVTGCQTDLGQVTSGVQSFKLTLLDPAPDPTTGEVGSSGGSVEPGSVTFDLAALGADGQLVAGEFDVDVYLSFAGEKVGTVSQCGGDRGNKPLASIHLSNGVAAHQTVPLVKAYGPTALWVEDRASPAIGASPIMHFAFPTIADLQTPLDPNAPTATYCSPWSGRHVTVDRATGDGQLVVTSVFPNAYVVADTGAMYDPATDRGGYNHLYVFSFGRPSGGIVAGRVLSQVSGNLSKFNGFSELNFPLQTYGSAKAAVPPVYALLASDMGNNKKLLKLDAATVRVSGKVCCVQTGDVCCGSAAPCAADDQWVKYNTFLLDLGKGCDAFDAVSVALPGKTFGTFDPLSVAGSDRTLTVTGMLKNSSGQNQACKGGPDVACTSNDDCLQAALNPDLQKIPGCGAALVNANCVEGSCRKGAFNFWTVQPRLPSDISLQ